MPLKLSTPDHPDIYICCENDARLENLYRDYVNEINICNDANRAAIKNFEL